MRLRLDLEGNAGVGELRDQHVVQDVAVIGRSPECDWQLDCGERLVSRRHAFISREGDSFVVYDASANGLYVNGAAEPLGEGQRAELSEGDRLHIGPFIVAVSVLDGPRDALASPETPAADAAGGVSASEPADETSPRQSVVSPSTSLPDSGATATRVTASRGLDLGETRDAFQPPSVTIPEDWDLDVEGDGDEDEDAGKTELGRHLELLEPDVMRGLLEGLYPESQDAEAPELSRQQAYALGASLRASLTALVHIRTELNAMERELPKGEAPSATSEQARREAYGALRRLLYDGNEEALQELNRIQALSADVPVRSRRLAVALNEAATTVVNVFHPARFRDRAEQAARTAHGLRGWLRSCWRRSMLRISPHKYYWRAFEGWYEERGNTAEGAVQTLFEKSLKRFILQGRQQGYGARTATSKSESR